MQKKSHVSESEVTIFLRQCGFVDRRTGVIKMH